jgi:hypothetical protein
VRAGGAGNGTGGRRYPRPQPLADGRGGGPVGLAGGERDIESPKIADGAWE